LTDQLHQTAPEERPETRIRFSEGDDRVNMPSSPQAMAYCLSGFRPAGNILLILSKTFSSLFYFCPVPCLLPPEPRHLIPDAFF